MDLDLRINGKLDSEQSKLLNEAASQIRRPFHDLIQQLSESNRSQLDWWVENPASRNTLASNLYQFCCYLVLVQKLIASNRQIHKIQVDSRALKKALARYLSHFENYRDTDILLIKKKRFISILQPFARIVTTIVYFFFQWLNCRVQSVTYYFGNQSLVLVDTVLYPGFIEEDRLYPGLWENLSAKEKEKVYFVPSFYGFDSKTVRSAIKKVRGSKRNFLVKEDFLTIFDLVFAFLHCFRAVGLRKKGQFKGIDITPLIREEIYSQAGYKSAVAAILNYRFAKRLSKKKVKLESVVNRFENQVVDKGWNLGFRTFFPSVKSIGYQGAVMPPHYLCLYPTKYEHDAGVLPDTTAVIGSGYIVSRKEFFPDLKVVVAPAFRCQWLWEERKCFPDGHLFTVLVALPIVLNDALTILDTLLASLEHLESKESIRFWIKPHPAIDPETIRQNIGHSWPGAFRFVDGAFNQWLERSDLLIGNMSFTCLEAIARGIPAIICANSDGLIQNPIPDSITSDIWELCNTAEGLKQAIEFYRHRSDQDRNRHLAEGNQIRQAYFEPITDEQVRKFLGIS